MAIGVDEIKSFPPHDLDPSSSALSEAGLTLGIVTFIRTENLGERQLAEERCRELNIFIPQYNGNKASFRAHVVWQGSEVR